ncbi:hypothetical protein SAMN05518684_11134 [Salipaludibacillus aurantiacus]|uniref:Uncharacterized protein n=1 Tax=Salipaludibacillus aurantiacus TaxID=1601833 RepID=A0A1H9VJW0_9BACI|nr:hypothetical protein SAMN05518684_11134 [Salipaludibacillus aurantiacus]
MKKLILIAAFTLLFAFPVQAQAADVIPQAPPEYTHG